MTTKRRFSGSGPKNEVNMPGVVVTEGSVMRASPSSDAANPPLEESTAEMTATSPPSMIMPCMKSLIAVAR